MTAEDDFDELDFAANVEPDDDGEPDDDLERDFEPIPLHRRAYGLAVHGRDLSAVADELEVGVEVARSLIADGGRLVALDEPTRIALAHGVLDEVARRVTAQAALGPAYGDLHGLLAVLVDAQRVHLDLIRYTTKEGKP